MMCLLTSLVISNMETWGLPKISLSLSSPLIIRLLAESWRLYFLMYSQSFLVISVRGSGFSPITAASWGLGLSAAMKAALGFRLVAALAGALAGDLAGAFA